MSEALPLSENKYAEFYEIDKPMIQFADGVNEIQHAQWSMIKIAKEQAKDKVWREVVSWVGQGGVLEKTETRGNAKEVLVARSGSTQRYSRWRRECWCTKAANKERRWEVWCRQICLPKSMITEVWSWCDQSNLGGHRGLEGVLSKLLKGFF